MSYSRKAYAYNVDMKDTCNWKWNLNTQIAYWHYNYILNYQTKCTSSWLASWFESWNTRPFDPSCNSSLRLNKFFQVILLKFTIVVLLSLTNQNEQHKLATHSQTCQLSIQWKSHRKYNTDKFSRIVHLISILHCKFKSIAAWLPSWGGPVQKMTCEDTLQDQPQLCAHTMYTHNNTERWTGLIAHSVTHRIIYMHTGTCTV